MNQFKINIDYEIVLMLTQAGHHGRQLSKNLDVPLTNIQRSLKYLEYLKVITFKRIGRNKTYYLKSNLRTKQMIISAECYKLHKLFSHYPKLAYILEDLQKFSDKLVIVFGSYAKFTAKSSSDIDIYVNSKEISIKKEIELINPEINVKLGEFDTDDLLIREIIKNHVIINGHEEYYSKIRKKIEEGEAYYLNTGRG